MTPRRHCPARPTLGIERVDTKPLAKTLINGFGDLPAVVAAPAERLRQAGLNKATIATLDLVKQAASHLTQADHEARPRLTDWNSLMAYLRPSLRKATAQHLGVLFLNNRNLLLADQSWPVGEEPSALSRKIVRRALELHATALILTRCRLGHVAAMSREDSQLAERLRKDGQPLAIVLHDYLVCDDGQWISLRQQGML